MRTKNLLNGKPEGGFLSLAAVLPSFGLALAVFAASVMAPAGCENMAGSGNGGEAVFAEEGAPEGAGGTTALSAGGTTKTIKVKFEVLNGGDGITWSAGIVGTQDNRYLIYDSRSFSYDYTITIIAPAGDEFLNVYWTCKKSVVIKPQQYYCKAKMKAESGTITLDYNGNKNVATKNLYDVDVFWDRDRSTQYADWWKDLEKRASSKEVPGTRRIDVKFNVKNGGFGLTKSEGIVSSQDDDYLVYDHGTCANDYTITIPVPPEDEYLNIRWKCTDGLVGATYVKARMKAESGTITLDYNGVAMSGPKVATKNLSDVAVGDYNHGKKNTPYGVYFGPDWEDARNRSVDD